MRRNVLLLLLGVQGFFSSQPVLAQVRTSDRVILTDSTVYEGRVSKVTESVIEMDPIGATRFLTITIDQVVRIEFRDGRVQVFDEPSVEVAAAEEVVPESTATILRKSPTSAWLRSFVIPGWGQFYNEDQSRGIFHLFVAVAAAGGGSFAVQRWAEANNACVFDGDCGDADVWQKLALTSFGISLVNWIWAQGNAYRGANAFNRRNGLVAFSQPELRVVRRTASHPRDYWVSRVEVSLLRFGF